MPLRLVLDSNVWLDWLVFNDAALEPVRQLVSSGGAEIIIDNILIGCSDNDKKISVLLDPLLIIGLQGFSPPLPVYMDNLLPQLRGEFLGAEQAQV